MKTGHRRFLLLSSGGLQAALLLTCVWLWAVWMNGQLISALRDQAIEQSRREVQHLAEMCVQFGEQVGEIGSPAWRRAQQVFDAHGASSHQSVVLIDRGRERIICASGLGASLRSRNGLPVDGRYVRAGNRRRWASIVRGSATVGCRVANTGLDVVRYQDRTAFALEAQRILVPLRALGIVAAIFIALCSGVMLSSVAKRYEQKIENVNQELDELVAERMREFNRTRDAIIYGLARLAESRDTDTGQHLDRIQHYSSALARKLGETRSFIDDDYVTKLRLASTLHDIGKVGIPDEILLKPGKLTDNERRIMQQHAVIGSQCLREIRERLGQDEFLDMAHNIAAGHHERWDGKGYPAGRVGEQTPLEARIVAVADVYDALRSKRVYKDAMSHEDALAVICQGSGTQFDPDVIEAFRACSVDFEQFSQSAANAEPEMCLLEKIRHVLAEAKDATEIDESLSFLQDAESNASESVVEPSMS